MNADLIKQLELALAVERGEVPLSEIQRRLRYDYISSNLELMLWNACHAHHTPDVWNHKEYEYRRKPKPLECWVNAYENGVMTAHRTQDQATDCSPMRNCGNCKLYHMREVIND